MESKRESERERKSEHETIARGTHIQILKIVESFLKRYHLKMTVF